MVEQHNVKIVAVQKDYLIRKMAKINFFGDIFSQTGYASHCRQLVNALYKLNPEIHLECQKPLNWVRHVNSNELAMINNPYYIHETDIMVNLPPFWQQCLAQKPKHFIGWCVWEGINVPKFWMKYLIDKRVDKIIVPSKHVWNTIDNTCNHHKDIINKIQIIPHGVNINVFNLNPKPHDKFTFIANKGWAQGINDRGGIQWLLKAFCEEFNKENDVELLLKINVAYNHPNWNFANELQNIGITPEITKNVKFILQNIDYNDLAQLYNQGDVFVSPTMGDAFNLPCLEAMACGLPVITTNFGGQTDYVNEQNGYLIDYKLVDVTWDMMYEGNKWAQPDLTHLREIMRYCYTNKEVIQNHGVLALNTASLYTWENSAKQLLDTIHNLE